MTSFESHGTGPAENGSPAALRNSAAEQPQRGLAGYREKSLVLTTALGEYRRLRAAGTAVSASSFCEQFPDYRKSLLRLLDVEDNLGDLGDMEDPFPTVGGLFLGFEILEELGIGAIARVYLASEPELGYRTVVIKVSAEGTAEATTLGRLQHPNIVQVHSVKRDPDSGMTAVCMPYQGSATLTDVLDLVVRNAALPERGHRIVDVARQMADMDVLRSEDRVAERIDPVLQHGSYVDAVVHIGIQLAKALEYAHSVGVLHRDLKPSNVLVAPTGCPMLLDFNLSFDAAQSTSPMGGTLPYMAPEQIRANLRRQDSTEATELDARCDVYSLGVILYELLTGRLPFGGPPDQLGPEAAALWQLRALDVPAQSVRALNPRVPANVADLVARCLAPVPGDRPAAMSAISTELLFYFRNSRRLARWVAHHAWISSLTALFIVSLLVAGVSYVALRPPLNVRLTRLAAAALAQNNPDRAMEWIAPVLRTNPESTSARLLHGLALAQKKKYRDAALDLAGVAEDAESAAVWECLAYYDYLSGEFIDAFAAYEKAIQLAPEQADLYLKCAIVAGKSPTISERVISYADRAIELDDQLTEAYLIRGVARAQAGSVDAAMADAQRAIDVSANAVWVRIFVADSICATLHEHEAARLLMQQQLKQAVAGGLSKSGLLSRPAFKMSQSEAWCQDLLETALDHASFKSQTLHDAMIPSLSVDIPVP